MRAGGGQNFAVLMKQQASPLLRDWEHQMLLFRLYKLEGKFLRGLSSEGVGVQHNQSIRALQVYK